MAFREEQALSKRASIAILVAMSLVTVAGSGLAAPNEEQSGSGTLCADYNVGYISSNVQVANETGNAVDVEANTTFEISTDGSGTPYVDFFNEDGEWLDYNEGNNTGVVPTNASYGIVCVAAVDSWPSAPSPTETWTYQDGFSVS